MNRKGFAVVATLVMILVVIVVYAVFWGLLKSISPYNGSSCSGSCRSGELLVSFNPNIRPSEIKALVSSLPKEVRLQMPLITDYSHSFLVSTNTDQIVAGLNHEDIVSSCEKQLRAPEQEIDGVYCKFKPDTSIGEISETLNKYYPAIQDYTALGTAYYFYVPAGHEDEWMRRFQQYPQVLQVDYVRDVGAFS